MEPQVMLFDEPDTRRPSPIRNCETRWLLVMRQLAEEGMTIDSSG
jgi:ABC-type histidine transport system ATPase subunit